MKFRLLPVLLVLPSLGVQVSADKSKIVIDDVDLEGAVHLPESAKRPTADIPITHDIDFTGRPESTLQDILRDTGLSGGVVEFQDCSGAAQVHLKARQGSSIRAAMGSLVAENQTYLWELRNGVVNLIEKPGLPPLLATKLGNFQADTNDKEVGTLFSDLMRLPEVRRRIASLKLRAGIWTGGLGAYEENAKPRQPVPIHFSIRDGSLRDAFNSIATIDRHAIWVYTERQCNGDRTYLVNILKD